MKTYLIASAFLATMSLSGCAHGLVEKQLDDKLDQETVVKNREDLHNESDQLIKTAPGLSDEQRKELTDLRDSTRTQSEQLREKAFKLRAVLIKDLLSPGYDSNEVDVVKSKIKEVEHDRLHLFFSSVRSVNTILGRWESRRDRDDEDFYDQMMLEMTDLYRL